MARKKPTKYERETLLLLEEFEIAAKDWGWTRDQGTGQRVVTSEQNFNEARAALLKRIQDLHSQRRKAEKLDQQRRNHIC